MMPFTPEGASVELPAVDAVAPPWTAGRLRAVLRSRPLGCLMAIAAGAALLSPGALFRNRSDAVVVRHLEFVPAWNPAAPDLRIVQVSGLRLRDFGGRERRLAERINGMLPDLIVIPGHLVRAGADPDTLEKFLSALRAPRGIFVVWGRQDHDAGAASGWGEEAVRRSGCVLLNNDRRRLQTPAGRITIAGIDDWESGRDNLSRAMSGIDRRDLAILLSSSLGVAGGLGNWDIDLVLAGSGGSGAVGWSSAGGGARLHAGREAVPPLSVLDLFAPPRIDVLTLRGGTAQRPRARRVPSFA